MSDWRPLVVAHRGASADEPEHSIAAYRRAIETGANALECDVRLSADGHLVCVHDRRVDRTSNGRGAVSTTDLADLRRLDWGSWRGLPGHTGPDRTGLTTLRDLLDLVVGSAPGVGLAIETKHPTRYGPLVERRLVEVLDEYDLLRPRPDRPEVRVMSFSYAATARLRRLAPEVPRVLLREKLRAITRGGRLFDDVGAVGISTDLLRLHPRYPAAVRRHGGQVFVYTVDTPDDLERCRAARVDAVITNRPDAVLALLGGAAPPRASTSGVPGQPGRLSHPV